MKSSLEGLGSRSHALQFRIPVLVIALSLLASSAVLGQPLFSKSFTPDTIGPGSTATLEFLIENTPQLRGR
ncbi:MAG: hypothetical protein OEP45_15310, partial [Acidobacteriota bacterium]|nr:hypothetical protein [Acidobacteriota bacterium]